MITEEWADLTGMYHGLVEKMAWSRRRDPWIDHAGQSSCVFSYGNRTVARTASFEFDLAYVGLRRPRWTRYLSEYASQEQVEHFLRQVKRVGRVRTVLFETANKARHSWGKCLLGVSFTPGDGHPKLMAFSRSLSLVPTAALDFAFVSRLAAEIEVPNASVTWFSASIDLSGILWLPYLGSSGKTRQYLRSDAYLASQARHCFRRLLKDEEIPWRSLRWSLARWKETRRKESKPIPVSSLPILRSG